MAGWRKAAVLDHVKAAVNRLLQDKGKHGLVRIYFADWNDALNVTTDEYAESVMLSHQFCLALKELEALLKKKRRSGICRKNSRGISYLTKQH